MSDDLDNPEDQKDFMAKIKKGQKIYQYVTKDSKNNIKQNSKYYDKFVNEKPSKKNIKDKQSKTNYVEQYHKRVNSNINNNINNLNYSIKREVEENKEKYMHNKTRSDIINYDYLFAIYKEMDKNNNLKNSVNNNSKVHHAKNQSMDNYLYNSIKEE